MQTCPLMRAEDWCCIEEEEEAFDKDWIADSGKQCAGEKTNTMRNKRVQSV